MCVYVCVGVGVCAWMCVCMDVTRVMSKFAITIPESCQDIPKSQGDHGKSLGFPCPTKATSVPLSFPSQSPKGTMGSPRDSHVPPSPRDSHVPTVQGTLGPVGVPISSPTGVHNEVNFKHF